jgi:hypothetical protein
MRWSVSKRRWRSFGGFDPASHAFCCLLWASHTSLGRAFTDPPVTLAMASVVKPGMGMADAASLADGAAGGGVLDDILRLGPSCDWLRTRHLWGNAHHAPQRCRAGHQQLPSQTDNLGALAFGPLLAGSPQVVHVPLKPGHLSDQYQVFGQSQGLVMTLR